MTDIGQRGTANAATETKQDDILTKLQTLHTDIAVIMVALLNEVKASLATMVGHLDALTEQVTETLVNAVVFDSAAETYTSPSDAVHYYRHFTLLIDLDVTGAPTDIQIQVRFSDDNTTFHQLMNGPFGDLRYEDTAGNKNEALVGPCLGDYMDIHCISSGCDGSNKFTLTAKVILTR